MRSPVALALALVLASVHTAHAKGAKSDDTSASDDDDDDSADSDQGSAKAKPDAKAKFGGKAKATTDSDDPKVEDDKTVEDEEEAKDGDTEAGSGSGGAAPAVPAVKQDLNGHDLASTHKRTLFERDRFWVDKKDTADTEDKTLIQGSFTSSSFLYTETGGPYHGLPPATAMGAPNVDDSARYTDLWTDLRLQTDFRHISGSSWDARVDGRVRFVDQPSSSQSQYDSTMTATMGTASITQNAVQSGFNGQNEYDLRELWLIHNGARSDVTVGRQYITDLGALKIDGVRVDYASSEKFTLLGFVGLYPLRGSRSVTTDYSELYTESGTAGTLSKAGNIVGAGGFGAAYRTSNAYGAIGGVALVPLQGETPRIYGTSNGYWRFGPTLDLYHFAIVDLIGNNDALGAGHAGLTNLSAGINYKPLPELRVTASYNRVDTDTLNVQAYQFLHNVDANAQIYDNEAYLVRLATDEVRGGVSAGLGPQQRFEISTAVTYRTNPGFTLSTPTEQVLGQVARAQGVEVWGGITDRRSIAGLRLSVDVSKTFGVGGIDFDRNEALAVRASASRELASGKGEWELSVEYASVQDQLFGTAATCTGQSSNPQSLPTCYGASSGTILTAGGLLYYRLSRDWLGVASVYINQVTNQWTMASAMVMGAITTTTDPLVTGINGYLRLAYRF